jgi:GTP-binding protein
MPFTVAILGRPNVGKSTLFNRLCGTRAALVHATPGVTRDRRAGRARISDLEFQVIDTAGLEEAEEGAMEAGMQAQTRLAMAEADVLMLVIDARAGVTPVDRHFADLVRRSAKPLVLVANKCEGRGGEAGMYDAFSLGLGDPVPISAEHGEGMADLYEALSPFRDEAEARAEAEARRQEAAAPDEGGVAEDGEEPLAGALQLAIVGRPNVGKSTLLNRLVGEERVVTGPEPGVTRDAIAVEWEWQGRRVRLVDTAGMRRRSRIEESLERMSVADSLRAIRFAQVAVLVLDGTMGLERQDLTIGSHVVAEGRALVVAVNKWDLVADRQEAMLSLRERLEESLPQIRGVRIVTLSALTGDGVDRLLPAVFEAFETWNRRVPTAGLNRWLADVLERHPPPLVAGRRLRLRYITQIKSRPPSFVLFGSRTEALPDAYRRYLVNGLRDSFGLDGVPIRLTLRRADNPYAGGGGR